MNLRLFMPHLERKARFENICFKLILSHAGNLRIYVGNLGTIVSRKLSRLNISYVDRTTLAPKGECPKFFSCSQYTSPSTKHG